MCITFWPVDKIMPQNGETFDLPIYRVVSVAQLIARRTHNRMVVGSIPAYAVCFTVDR